MRLGQKFVSVLQESSSIVSYFALLAGLPSRRSYNVLVQEEHATHCLSSVSPLAGLLLRVSGRILFKVRIGDALTGGKWQHI